MKSVHYCGLCAIYYVRACVCKRRYVTRSSRGEGGVFPRDNKLVRFGHSRCHVPFFTSTPRLWQVVVPTLLSTKQYIHSLLSFFSIHLSSFPLSHSFFLLLLPFLLLSYFAFSFIPSIFFVCLLFSIYLRQVML